MRELTEMAEAAGLGVKVVPTVSQLLGEPVALDDIRTPTMADLLGRREIDTDLASIAGYLTNRRVLVTGAGGSIGSELCRQVYRFRPSALHEVLWGGLEHDRRQVHDLICQVRVPPIDPAAVWDLGTTEANAALIRDLRDASSGVPEISSASYRRLTRRLPVDSAE